MSDLWPWLALFGLGAYHGINPGMGWLFAVALGTQEKKRQAVLAALPPIALGHALSIGIIVLLVALAQITFNPSALRVTAALVLFGFGLYRLVRFRHPKWVGMRVGFGDLTLWSFIMASAHGAGLMLVPILLHSGHAEPGTLDHSRHTEHFNHLARSAAAFSTPAECVGAVAVHTLGHLLVAGLVAIVIFEKLGLALLTKAWFNLDLMWLIALIVSGFLVLVF
jgi:hypothetical protein